MCLAIPGQVLSVQGDELERVGKVQFAGIEKEVNLSFVPEASVGDYVLVHVGVALSRIEEAEAQRVLAMFESVNDTSADQPKHDGPAGGKTKLNFEEGCS